MIEIIESKHVDTAAWNQRVTSLTEGTFAQSTYIEDDHLVTGGWFEPLYLLAQEDGQALGQLILLRGLNTTGKRFLDNRIIKKIFNRLFRSYVWSGGPLILEKNRYAEIQRALLQHVDRKARSESYMIKRASIPYYEWDDLCREGEEIFFRQDFGATGSGTFLIALDKELDELWSNLKSSARKNLKKIKKSGKLTIREIETEKEIEAYWQMLCETHRRSGRTEAYLTMDEFLGDFWELPHRQGILRGFIVFTAEKVPVAGLLCRCFNGWIQELGVAYSNYSIKKKIYGQDLIKWHIIEWGQEQGYQFYDLMGVEINSQDPKKQGIYQFKAKWGGTFYSYNTFSKVYSQWKNALIRGVARSH